MKLLRTLSLVAALVPAALSAQGVLVAPTGVFIDPQTHGASIEAYNPGNEPVEVSISMMFGYPVSDSLGRVTLRTVANTSATMPSAASWVEAFPRRLILRPRERRTIRLLARPPASLPDGEYWSRLIVTTKGSRVALQAPAATSAIQVGLKLEVRTIVALFYRKGHVSTGLTMSDPSARLTRDSLEVCTHLHREGNAAFLGTLHTTVTDSTGARVFAEEVPLAVYYGLAPCVTAPAPKLSPGQYVVHLLVDTDRHDLKEQALLPIAAIRDSVVVTVAPRTR
jgi:hypothetical protein